MGDARYNMGNSLMIGCAKMGLHFVACAPKAYWPNPELVAKCREFARLSGGSITLSEDTDAVAGADVLLSLIHISAALSRLRDSLYIISCPTKNVNRVFKSFLDFFQKGRCV